MVEQQTRRSELSPKEREILRRAMIGLTDKAIAQELGISPATVKSYWVRIRQKVGGFTRTQAVANEMQHRRAQDEMADPHACAAATFEEVIRRAPTGILVLELSGRIVLANRDFFGVAKEALAGGCFFSFCDDDSRDEFYRVASRAVKSGDVQRFAIAIEAGAQRRSLQGSVRAIGVPGDQRLVLYIDDLAAPPTPSFPL
jgi:DNA-binding CsgD family transcriptional regulator